MPRTPTNAAALNFFIWGVGHAYLGRRRALMFPWIYWTIGLAIWNVIGIIAWASGAFYAEATDEFGFTLVVGINYGAAAAFFLIPTFLVGGLLAYDVYKGSSSSITTSNNPIMNRLHHEQQPQAVPVAAPAPAPAPAPTGNICRSCGAVNNPGDLFCASCGASMTAAPSASPPPAATPATKVCSNCGTINPTTNSFCKRCGTRLG